MLMPRSVLCAARWRAVVKGPAMRTSGRIVYRDRRPLPGNAYAVARYQITIDGSTIENRPPKLIPEAHRLPPALRHVVEGLDEAATEPDWTPTTATVQDIVLALGMSIDQRRPAARALSKLAYAVLDQARGRANIPSPPPPAGSGVKDKTPGEEQIFMDLADRAFTVTEGNPVERHRLSRVLQRLGISEAKLKDYRHNLQRTKGRTRAERGALLRRKAKPFPTGIDTPDQQREWLLSSLENLAVTLAFS
jgi:hypothetical protein